MIREWDKAVAFAEIMLRGVKENVAEHGFLVPTVFMQLAKSVKTGKRCPEGEIAVIPIDMSVDKDAIVDGLRAYAKDHEANMVIMATECYMLVAQPQDLKTTGPVSEHPDRQEIVMVTLEFDDRHACWMAPLVDQKLGPFSRTDGDWVGRFADILPKKNRVLH